MFYEDDYVETPACAKCGETCTTGICDMCLLRAVDKHEVMSSQQNDQEHRTPSQQNDIDYNQLHNITGNFCLRYTSNPA